MSSIPVASKTWRHLFRELASSPLGRNINRQPRRLLQEFLSPAASVALWIVKFAPELMARPTLHIVIAGAAASQDSADDGRWYQCIPELLGVPGLRIQVDLVGKELDESADNSDDFMRLFGKLSRLPGPCAAVVENFAAAGRYGQSLGEYLNSRRGSPAPDLIFMFHPGFQSHGPEWVLSGDLRMAISLNIPVGAAAFADDEHMLEAWMLAAYGYAAENGVLENPFCGVTMDGLPIPTSFAKLLWKLSTTLPPTDVPLTSESASKIEFYELWCTQQIRSGRELPPMSSFGQLAPGIIDVITGEAGEFITLPSGLFLERATGFLWDDSDGGRMRRLDIEVPGELLDEYPRESSLNFDRAIWALEVEEFIDEVAADAENESISETQETLEAFLAEFAQMATGFVAPEVTPGCDEFFSALESEQWPMAEALIAKRPDLIHAVGPQGKTALFWALDARNLNFAEKLLAAGAKPSPQDAEGFTPLHDAARRRDDAAGALLLRWRADLNIRTGMGWSPLLTAMSALASNMAAQLVEAGADLHQPNFVGMTPATIYEEVPLAPCVAQLIRERLSA